MKGISELVKRYAEGRLRVNINHLTDFTMDSGMVDEESDNFRRSVHRSANASVLNSMDFYSTGDGQYTHISAMSANELKRTRDRINQTADSLKETVKRMDGQISFLVNGDLLIPEPVKIRDGSNNDK